MLYKFFSLLVPRALPIYFRKVYVHGIEKFKGRDPLILACNHPNSFMDGVIIAGICLTLSLRNPYFLARGDVFRSKLARWFLIGMKILPIYRRNEDPESNKKNDDSFRLVNRLLNKNQIVGIYPEGRCVVEKRLRPVKKGTARMAFGAEVEHNWELGVKILPTGVNYTHAKKFRGDFILDIGEPIIVSDYRKLYEENESRAVAKLTEDIAKALEQHVIIISDPKDDAVAEIMLDIYRNDKLPRRWISEWIIDDPRRFLLEKSVGEKFSGLAEETKAKIKEKTSTYSALLKKFKISDKQVAKDNRGIFIPALLQLILTLPFRLTGWPLFYPIAAFAHRRAFSIRDDQFHSSVQFFASLLMYIGLFLIILIPAYIISWQTGSIVFLALLASAYGSFWFSSALIRVRRNINYRKIPAKDLKYIKSLRAELKSLLD